MNDRIEKKIFLITYLGYEHLTMTVDVEKVEPERLLTFRWHPIPPARRDEAWRMNERGWSEQMKNIERHVSAG